MSLPRHKWKFESNTSYGDAERALEESVNPRLERGKVSAYRTPTMFGIVFSWKGINRTAEQEHPFDADQVVTMVTEWANKMENSGLARGWSYDPWC
jgi:hypothetical protein